MQDLKIVNMYQEAYIRAKCFKGLFTHDISNLFQIISNSLELCENFLKEGFRTEVILEYFKLIEEQVNRGKQLVRNVRNLSDLEEFEMPLEPINLFENLKNAIQFVQVNFPKRTIKFEINSEMDIIYVIANNLLVDVFENILINSIVYNKNDLIYIEISVSEINDFSRNFIKIEFKDNGIGIEDARKKEILQESHKKSENSKGMGIGLSLVAKFIDLCDGRMWIEDRIMGDPSKGTNFVILIPTTTQKELLDEMYQRKLKEKKKGEC